MYKYTSRYLVPYFVLAGINLVVWMLMQKLHLANGYGLVHYLIGILYSRGSTEWMPNCSPLWFLTAQFAALVIYTAISRFSRTAYIRTGVVLVCMCVSSLLDVYAAPKLFWNLDSALMAVGFLEVGHYFRVLNESGRFPERTTWSRAVFHILLSMVGIGAIWMNPVENVSFDNNQYGNLALMLVGGVSLTWVFIDIAKTVSKKTPLLSRALQFYGRHTLLLMGFDYLSGFVSTFVLNRLGLTNSFAGFVGKIILLTLGIYVWSGCIRMIRSKKVQVLLSY